MTAACEGGGWGTEGKDRDGAVTRPATAKLLPPQVPGSRGGRSYLNSKPSGSQGPGIPSVSPKWVARVQTLNHHLLPPRMRMSQKLGGKHRCWTQARLCSTGRGLQQQLYLPHNTTPVNDLLTPSSVTIVKCSVQRRNLTKLPWSGDPLSSWSSSQNLMTPVQPGDTYQTHESPSRLPRSSKTRKLF